MSFFSPGKTAKSLNAVPEHVAIIMDGNGRWAQQQGLARTMGHERGFFRALEIIEAAKECGVKHLTLYAFSKENWQRPPDEVGFLMDLMRRYFSPAAKKGSGEPAADPALGLWRDMDNFQKLTEREKLGIAESVLGSVRLRVIGNLRDLPGDLQKKIKDAVEKSRDYPGLSLTIALSYSSRLEILDACKALAAQAVKGTLKPADIDEARVSAALYTAGTPDPDLLIRTSGEYRVSNFLLWQLSYSEIYVTPRYWPEFDSGEFLKALEDYQKRERRFGKVEGSGRDKNI